MLRSGSARTVLTAFVLGLVLMISRPASAQECGDVNQSGGITASDALIVLRKAVELDETLFCPNCGCTTTTTVLVTTTTLPGGTTTTLPGGTTTTLPGGTTTTLPGGTTTTTVGATTTTSTTTTTIPDSLQGTYSGTFDGDQSGTFEFTIGPGGDVIGNGSNDGGGDWALAGTAEPNGDVEFVSAEFLLPKQFDGAVHGQSGNATGGWFRLADPLINGDWSADKQP